NPALTRADAMIMGAAPGHQAHRNFPATRLRRSALCHPSQTGAQHALTESRRRHLCLKTAPRTGRARPAGRHVCAGQDTHGGVAICSPRTHVTRRYGRTRRAVILWTTPSVTRPIRGYRPRVTAPDAVTWS